MSILLPFIHRKIQATVSAARPAPAPAPAPPSEPEPEQAVVIPLTSIPEPAVEVSAPEVVPEVVPDV